MTTTTQKTWTPDYSPWRGGGWYVHNVRYPSGACGCVSRNYPDKKWRIVCDDRPNAHNLYTYRTRDEAARAELALVEAMKNPEPDPEPTMPARCIECGAVEQVPLADVPEEERHLTMVETCCDACLKQIEDELAELQDLHYTVTTDWDGVRRTTLHPTKRDALDIAQELREDLPNAIIQVSEVRYGQGVALSWDEWRDFPEPCDTCHYRPCQCDRIPQESDPNPFLRGIALFALLICFLALTTHTASARDYRDVDTRHYDPSLTFILPSAPPEGCTLIEPSGEGFPRAQCVDGTYYRDMDGSIDREPGTWTPEQFTR